MAYPSLFAYSVPALHVQDKNLLMKLCRSIRWHRIQLRKLWQNLSSKKITPEEIQITKELLYDKYTLEDTYPYKDTTQFPMGENKGTNLLCSKIYKYSRLNGLSSRITRTETVKAPLVKNFKRNAYGRVADTLGVERYQSVPLYLLTDTVTPERYGQDGELTRFIEDGENFVKAEPIFTEGEWMIPKKYVKVIGDTVVFNKAIFVDRHNQNITALERTEKGKWVVRSMNPSTTGLHRPPYAQETPLGMFVLQEKKVKMIFLKDGSKETGGYAPYASRFTDGAYIHGVPVNEPRKTQIEYSWSLGTTPRSHMCVRNATSHAKFIFDWAPVNETIIFVLE